MRVQHHKLAQWIDECAQLCQPDHIHLCSGSDEEYRALIQTLIQKHGMVALSKRPESYWCHSDPSDVARVEECTFICSKRQEDAGPTNHWRDPTEMKGLLRERFKGCMKGRTLYVVPFSMGPLGSHHSVIGVEITDSPFVVCNMKVMTRMGQNVLDALGKEGPFIPCLHSVGKPLSPGEGDVPWPCNPKEKYIVHFPEERLIWSYGSGYGGNSLLGKKCLALRIASSMAKEQGWLAEHMLILGVTNPEGVKRYMVAAFPSACGKTNLAMLSASLPGWKFECVGDDIAWMRFDASGKLRAINPEYGFFGVAPGTSPKSNPNAIKTIEKNTLFTNTALTDEGDVWWEGLSEPPQHLTDWKGNSWTPESKEPAAHPNSRFTAPLIQCPTLDPNFENPEGVPISAILFGGRRATVMPLIYEALNWNHGVLMGASLSSEKTAAAVGSVGDIRHDPFAMLPFCGYHMGDYFKHWVEMGGKGHDLPKIFAVNWFRKDASGRFLWPGFQENARIIKWVFERCEGEGQSHRTAIGIMPTREGIDLKGLSISSEDMSALLSVDRPGWLREVSELESYFKLFGERFPKELADELNALKHRLSE